MTPKILSIDDIRLQLGVSRSTIARWISEARRGLNDFPLPFLPKGRRLLWTATCIENWINNRQAPPPVKTFASSKKRRQESKAFQERQKIAKAVIEKHRRADRTK
jgi:predicted DNA-binding transcriptional regulator AlpA